MLYTRINLPSDEPVEFVGVYVLKWGRAEAPTVGFRVATPEEIQAEAAKQVEADFPADPLWP